jgi:hypothetical protein
MHLLVLMSDLLLQIQPWCKVKISTRLGATTPPPPITSPKPSVTLKMTLSLRL